MIIKKWFVTHSRCFLMYLKFSTYCGATLTYWQIISLCIGGVFFDFIKFRIFSAGGSAIFQTWRYWSKALRLRRQRKNCMIGGWWRREHSPVVFYLFISKFGFFGDRKFYRWLLRRKQYYNIDYNTNSKLETVMTVRISKCLRKYFHIFQTYNILF